MIKVNNYRSINLEDSLALKGMAGWMKGLVVKLIDWIKIVYLGEVDSKENGITVILV
jgi:hypothetical protein